MRSDRIRVLLINPPTLCWKMLEVKSDFFFTPLQYMMLAAEIEDIADIRILDCNPLKIGWNSLERKIAQYSPDIVGISGNDTMYIDLVEKVCSMVKRVKPEALTVAGGVHLSLLPEESMNRLPSLDVVVIGEGEATFRHLVKTIINGGDLKEVPGIVYRNSDFHDEKSYVYTGKRAIISDLNSLKRPAFHLLPMAEYSRRNFWKGAVPLYHGKGCTNNCSFCVGWLQESQWNRKDGEYSYTPCYRTKSPERMIEEMEWLRKDYDVRYFWFIDLTFNASMEFNQEFSERILRKGWKDCSFFALMRLDLIIRDEEAGIFGDMVRAGLRNMVIGVERADIRSLKNYNKGYQSMKQIDKGFRILERYPELYVQPHYLFGSRDESPSSASRLRVFMMRYGGDVVSLNMITPFPGSPMYKSLDSEGLIEEKNWEKYDLLTPIFPSRYMSREEISKSFLLSVLLTIFRIAPIIKGLFSPHKERRRCSFNLFLYLGEIAITVFYNILRMKKDPLKKDIPSWHAL